MIYTSYDHMTEYCLMSAWELGELSPLAHAYVRHLPRRFMPFSLDAIADGTVDIQFSDITTPLEQQAVLLTPRQRSYVASAMLPSLHEWIVNKSKQIAATAAEAFIQRTPLQQHIEANNHLQLYLEQPPSERMQRLTALFNEHQILTFTDALHPANVARYLRAVMADDVDPVLMASLQFLDANLSSPVQIMGAHQERHALLAEAQHHRPDSLPYMASTGSEPTAPEKTGRRAKKRTHQRIRKAIRRAIGLFPMVNGGEQVISLFLSGQRADISGQVFNYHITKTQALTKPMLSFHHIPYDLEISDKDSGLILANLCVVFDQQPVLDQIFSLMLHLTSSRETEEQVLATANFFNVRKQARNSETFCRYAGHRHASVIPRQPPSASALEDQAAEERQLLVRDIRAYLCDQMAIKISEGLLGMLRQHQDHALSEQAMTSLNERAQYLTTIFRQKQGAIQALLPAHDYSTLRIEA